MINLDHSGKRRGTDLGRAFARFFLAIAVTGAAYLAVSDGTILATLAGTLG